MHTASHELVHFIKENAPEHYDALEALVTKELVKGGYSIDKLIDEQRKKAVANGQNLTEAELREEMIAEACQSFLASKSAASEIKALKTKNKSLWTALKKFFISLFAKINKVYKTVPPDSAAGQYIASMRKAVKPIRDAFMEGAVEAAKNAASGNKDADIKHKIRYPKFSESNISDNMSALAEMQPVAIIDESKMKKTGKKPVEIFNDYFNSLGNNIYSDVFGDIALSRSSAKSEIRHGITAEKIASIEAIPSVITNGKVIFSATKAKSDVERIVVAAPIKIGNDDYYMGVML